MWPYIAIYCHLTQFTLAILVPVHQSQNPAKPMPAIKQPIPPKYPLTKPSTLCYYSFHFYSHSNRYLLKNKIRKTVDSSLRKPYSVLQKGGGNHDGNHVPHAAVLHLHPPQVLASFLLAWLITPQQRIVPWKISLLPTPSFFMWWCWVPFCFQSTCSTDTDHTYVVI